MFFIKFETPIINDIRKEVNDLIPSDFVQSTRLGYIDNYQHTTDKILSLTSVKELLYSLNLSLEDVAICAFTVCLPDQGLPLHIDKGPYQLSMNIPITESKGTFVNFYKSTSPPIEVFNGNNRYYSVIESDCTLADILETDGPCIVDTSVPHKVINNTSQTRIMLLIRFKSKIKFSDFNLAPYTGIEPV
jgi:hypothetical protein